MQCITCQKYLDRVSNGFTVCPYCNSVNIPTAILNNSHSKLPSRTLVVAGPGKVRKITNKKLLIVGIALIACLFMSTAGLFTYENFRSSGPQSPSTVQSRTWEAEDNKLNEAQHLITENKLDEAAILLAQIDKSYPHYQEVIDLQNTVEAKRAEVAKQNAIEQPKPTTNSSPSKNPTSGSVAPAAPAFTSPIKIRGDTACQSSTLEALKLLSQKAPVHYAIVTKYVGIIECGSQGSGMFAYENPTRYLVGDATRNAGTVWYAGTIAHDAGHSQLYHTYVSNNPGTSVPNDVWTGESAEKTCLEAQYDALTKIGGTQSQLDYIRNVINSEYYNVPYDQRWW